MMDKKQKLSKNFYTRDVHTVAKDLLGKLFVRKIGRKVISGMIVEVEAYDGLIDEASHSFSGKTKRNEVMFNEGGELYVYFTYGMHFCANVVTGRENESKAVLIRALQPVDGIDLMTEHRYNKKEITRNEFINLTNGPAKLCKAFKIEREQNGKDLTGDEIFILKSANINQAKIAVTTRIGIKKSVDLPWRYYIKDNPFVSKK